MLVLKLTYVREKYEKKSNRRKLENEYASK
jgi:hypothetical protein